MFHSRTHPSPFSFPLRSPFHPPLSTRKAPYLFDVTALLQVEQLHDAPALVGDAELPFALAPPAELARHMRDASEPALAVFLTRLHEHCRQLPSGAAEWLSASAGHALLEVLLPRVLRLTQPGALLALLMPLWDVLLAHTPVHVALMTCRAVPRPGNVGVGRVDARHWACLV